MKLRVDAYHLSRFTVEKVGTPVHAEYWIPAEDFPDLTQNIFGTIVVMEDFK